MKVRKTGDRTDSIIDMKDAKTFDEVYRGYYAPLCLFAERFTRDKSDAEDIIENLFLRIWNQGQTFQNIIHIRSFLYNSAKNACLDHIKTADRANRRYEYIGRNIDIIEESTLNEMVRAEVLGEIYREIMNLPAQCGKVISMSYLEGLKNEEIAEKLGISVQTVKNQKGKGLRILRRKLSNENYLLLLMYYYFIEMLRKGQL